MLVVALIYVVSRPFRVWWGVLAVRTQLGEQPPADAAAVLAAAERWVRQPTDEHRYAA